MGAAGGRQRACVLVNVSESVMKRRLLNLLPMRQPNPHMPRREMLYSALTAFLALLLLGLEIRLAQTTLI